MANVKISQLPAAGPLAATDALPLVQGAATAKATVANLDTRNDGRYLRKGQNEAPGSELAYAQVTSPTPINITASTVAAGQTVVSAGAVNFDGSPVLIEFFADCVIAPTGNASMFFNLWDSSTELGYLSYHNVVGYLPIYAVKRIVPTVGSHTYMVKSSVGTGTGMIYAAGGGAGAHNPAFIRITKV